MKSRFPRTLLLISALLGACGLLSIVGTRAHSTPPASALAAATTPRAGQQLARANPFDFRAASATALWSAALAPAVVTTIVNYDFNSGTSYSSLTPTLAAGVLSG